MSYYQNTRAEVTPFIPAQYTNVLEIGCGAGTFRSHFSSEHTYWGVEPFEVAATKAEQSLDHVLNMTFDEALAHLPDGHFDLVICNDVIEHLPETNDFLVQIRQKMTHDGYLVGSVPNIRYFRQLFELLVQRDWQYRDAGILDNTHLRFYTFKSFEKTLGENDFNVEELLGINGPSGQKLFQRVAVALICTVLGRDTRYPQMAFRAKNNASAAIEPAA